MNASLQKTVASSFVIWVLVAIACFFYLFTFNGFRLALRPDRINFGIDLVGGTYITLEVQVDKALETELAERTQSLAKKLEDEGTGATVKAKVEGKKSSLTFESIDAANKAVSFIKNADRDLQVSAD